jgi:hypothetical protein
MPPDPAETIDLQLRLAGAGVPASGERLTSMAHSHTRPGLYDDEEAHRLRWVGSGRLAAPRP